MNHLQKKLGLNVFKRANNTDLPYPSIPEGQRVYAIGDIHGRVDLLSQLLKTVDCDSQSAPNRDRSIVFLGDYVDRGPNSKEVIDTVLNHVPDGIRPIYLKGNHEDALLKFLSHPEFILSWKNYGGLDTIASYGVTLEIDRLGDPSIIHKIHKTFCANLPPEHLALFQSLQTCHSIGDYFFVHAGVRPGIRLQKQVDEDLMWIRDEFLSSSDNFGKVIVHGHSPKTEPEIKFNRIGIDTGAYLTNTLSCLVLEGRQYRFLQS